MYAGNRKGNGKKSTVFVLSVREGVVWAMASCVDLTLGGLSLVGIFTPS